MKLDRFDVQILQALQENGRLPAARLGAQIGLSTSPTWERVRKLEEAGVLRGYHADIAVDQLTQLTQVLVPVALGSHHPRDFQRFEQAIAKIPQIVECWAVGGEVDYVLRFVVAGVRSYQAAIEETLNADLGVRQYWSYVVTRSVKPNTGLPLRRLLDKSS